MARRGRRDCSSSERRVGCNFANVARSSPRNSNNCVSNSALNEPSTDSGFEARVVFEAGEVVEGSGEVLFEFEAEAGAEGKVAGCGGRRSLRSSTEILVAPYV